MNASELLNRIIANGADKKGIDDRFIGNHELYKQCFLNFLNEPHFERLNIAIEEKDYKSAFESAHALKGESGNLGLTNIFGSISVLVESLRAQKYDNLNLEYSEVKKQLQILNSISSDNTEVAESSSFESDFIKSNCIEPCNEKKKKDRFMLVAGIAIGLSVLVIIWLFFGVLSDYRSNITKESADHVTEINYQIKLYIEESIANDWKIAQSVGNSISASAFASSDEELFEMLVLQRDAWQVTDLILYTENGFGIDADGDVEKNDIASESIDKSRELGKYMSIIESDLICTIPITTELRYKGSKIAAVSVVHSMKSFLDDMGFSSFDGSARMYLTDKSGIVISKLSNAAVTAFNITSVIENNSYKALKGDTKSEDYLSVKEPTAFLMNNTNETDYVVSTPVDTGSEPLHLFYFAPELVVNDSMSDFSDQLVFWSFFSIAIFGFFALIFLKYTYNIRKNRFNKEIFAREHMFDLLVKNTKAAFALFSVNQDKPTYISSNAASIIGEPYWTLDKTDSGYELRSGTGEVSKAICQANEMISGWDGCSEFQSEYILNEKSAYPSYFEYTLYPVDENGTDFVGIAQDVTKAYQREEATKKAMEMAEQANKAKSRFLSNMSHDIRTPMNAIMNMTNFAIESIDQPSKLRTYLQTISESSEHLLRLINDVLDMSRIESGRIDIIMESFNIVEEMKRQTDMIRPLSNSKEQILITDFDGVKTNYICGDRLKFSQIIMNLLSNAVKFTPEKGAVRFTAQEMPSLREDTANIRFIIEDTGIGISEDYISHIFEPFSRANSKRVNKIEGTGLGLSICQSYVNAMGGSIKCESEEGEGTTFIVELFFQKAAPQTEDNSSVVALGEEPFLGKRCLVGEDNATNQLIAKTMLERLGFLVDTASDGWETAQKFIESNKGRYDVIYMDVQMPIMDGYQASVTIRESGHPQAKTIPIIAMTANVFAEDIEKARIAGMDGHLGKPIMSIAIVEETNKALNKKRGKQ